MLALFHYINRYATTLLSEKDFEAFSGHFIKKKVGRKEYLLREGEVCKYFAFILKGAMCKYHTDEKGAEHIVDLYIENWWAGDRESFVLSTPTIYTIIAREDCEVLLISRENTIKLCNEWPPFNELLLKLDERNSIASQKRITSSISLTAEKRYADFVDGHPYFVNRFPQHIIASYLGITKDTLSRVRKKALWK